METKAKCCHKKNVLQRDQFIISPCFRLIMLLCEGGDLFERVSKSEYRLTEAKCQIFMRQILRNTFQYPSTESVVFFIASLLYVYDFFPPEDSLTRFSTKRIWQFFFHLCVAWVNLWFMEVRIMIYCIWHERDYLTRWIGLLLTWMC
jgi:hypothetical protein